MEAVFDTFMCSVRMRNRNKHTVFKMSRKELSVNGSREYGNGCQNNRQTGCRLDSIGLRQGSVASFWQHDTEHVGSIHH
jgi:hypothetical protein